MTARRILSVVVFGLPACAGDGGAGDPADAETTTAGSSTGLEGRSTTSAQEDDAGGPDEYREWSSFHSIAVAPDGEVLAVGSWQYENTGPGLSWACFPEADLVRADGSSAGVIELGTQGAKGACEAVVLFATDGERIDVMDGPTTWGGGVLLLSKPLAAALGGDDQLFVASAFRIQRFDAAAEPAAEADYPDGPLEVRALAPLADGGVLMLLGSQLRALTSELEPAWDTDLEFDAYGVGVGSAGQIYAGGAMGVDESSESVLVRLDSSGAREERFAATVPGVLVEEAVVGPNEVVYVVYREEVGSSFGVGLAAIDASGELRWDSAAVGSGSVQGRLRRRLAIDASGDAYVASDTEQEVVKVAGADGTVIWRAAVHRYP